MERVRLGMIGCGSMARAHGVRFAEVPEAQIVALADPSEASIESFAAKVFKDGERPPAYADHRAMLAEVPLDGVVIVSPHAHHFAQVTDALNAGCHVLVEKPMVIRTEDAEALIRHAAAAQRVVSVAFPGPFSREFAYVRGLVERGELGEIRLVTGVCAQPWIQHVGGTWRTSLELSGGGNLYDSGAHMFNAMLYLTGLAATEVFSFVENRDQEVDLAGAVTLRLDNGALATAAVSGDAAAFEQGVYIQGTLGSIRTSIYGGSLSHWNGEELVKYPVVPPTPSLQQNFVDCILGRATTPSPPELGLRQARLMDAIYESARTGRAVGVEA